MTYEYGNFLVKISPPFFKIDGFESRMYSIHIKLRNILHDSPLKKNEFKSRNLQHLLQPLKDGNIFKNPSIFSAFSVSPEEVTSSTLAWSPSFTFHETLSGAVQICRPVLYLCFLSSQNKDAYEKTLLEGCFAFTAAAQFNGYQ